MAKIARFCEKTKENKRKTQKKTKENKREQKKKSHRTINYRKKNGNDKFTGFI